MYPSIIQNLSVMIDLFSSFFAVEAIALDEFGVVSSLARLSFSFFHIILILLDEVTFAFSIVAI